MLLEIEDTRVLGIIKSHIANGSGIGQISKFLFNILTKHTVPLGLFQEIVKPLADSTKTTLTCYVEDETLSLVEAYVTKTACQVKCFTPSLSYYGLANSITENTRHGSKVLTPHLGRVLYAVGYPCLGEGFHRTDSLFLILECDVSLLVYVLNHALGISLGGIGRGSYQACSRCHYLTAKHVTRYPCGNLAGKHSLGMVFHPFLAILLHSIFHQTLLC